MAQFHTKRRVSHAASDMFALVADLERYPEFVPLCQSLHIQQRTPGETGVETIIADMTVAYKKLHETFKSRITLDRSKLQILVEHLDGPFSRMENRWSFHATDEQACDIDFFIVYEIKSRVLAVLLGTMVELAFRRFAEAFERRADALYPRAGA